MIRERCSDEGVGIVDLVGEGVGASAAHFSSLVLCGLKGVVRWERVIDIVEGVGGGEGSSHVVGV